MDTTGPSRHLDAPTAAVLRALLDYMSVHPTAADTYRGIVTWWLPEDPARDPQAVHDALDVLVEMGRLKVRQLPSGDSWYYPPLGSERGAP